MSTILYARGLRVPCAVNHISLAYSRQYIRTISISNVYAMRVYTIYTTHLTPVPSVFVSVWDFRTELRKAICSFHYMVRLGATSEKPPTLHILKRAVRQTTYIKILHTRKMLWRCHTRLTFRHQLLCAAKITWSEILLPVLSVPSAQSLFISASAAHIYIFK